MSSLISLLGIVLLLSASVIAALTFGMRLPLKEVATDVGLVAGIVTGVGVIFTKFVKPFFFHIQHVTKLMQGLEAIVAQHQEMDFKKLVKDVNTILHDLNPNSGTSLRDAINRIEAKLVSVERTQWAIRQDGPIGIFRCDAMGRNIEVNRTYCRWLGVGTDELQGLGWRKFLVDSEMRDSWDDQWRPAFADGREVEFVITLRGVDGVAKEYDIHAYPLPNAQGEVNEYLGILYPRDQHLSN